MCWVPCIHAALDRALMISPWRTAQEQYRSWPWREGLPFILLNLCMIFLQENSFILEGVLLRIQWIYLAAKGSLQHNLGLNALLCAWYLTGCACSGSLLHESLIPKYVTVSSHVHNTQNSQTVFLLSQNRIHWRQWKGFPITIWCVKQRVCPSPYSSYSSATPHKGD